MLTYNEPIELRDKLANGEIGLELAKAQYWKDFKEGQKSWDTKDWKERWSKIIKEHCEICSSKDTLTLQHLLTSEIEEIIKIIETVNCGGYYYYFKGYDKEL